MYKFPAFYIVRALCFRHGGVGLVFQLCQLHLGIAAAVALHVLSAGYGAQPSAGWADVYFQHVCTFPLFCVIPVCSRLLTLSVVFFYSVDGVAKQIVHAFQPSKAQIAVRAVLLLGGR